LSREAGCRYAAESNDIMFHVYILESEVSVRRYIGSCESLDRRLSKHNSGSVRSTKAYRPWKIIYTEEFETRSEAYKREKEIKSFKGGIKLKRLLGLFAD